MKFDMAAYVAVPVEHQYRNSASSLSTSHACDFFAVASAHQSDGVDNPLSSTYDPNPVS